jgi:phosphoribosylformimino-5-aminoimidazole carboxamide ribotide isomerase
MSFTLYAAVDLAGGKAVRLRQGDPAHARVVADDPVALAQRLADDGAPFLHVVDLDAAFGTGDNVVPIERLIAAVRCPVQVGGGVRNDDRARRLRDAGAARVVLGTAAWRDGKLLDRLLAAGADGVVVAADVRNAGIAVEGWRETSGERLRDGAARMRALGVQHLLVTAVERDGTGAGVDQRALEEALERFGPGVIASGGVGSAADVRDLAASVARGLAGVVVGSLLVDGKATVAELLAAAAGLGVDP